jgi:hypothetical protein
MKPKPSTVFIRISTTKQIRKLAEERKRTELYARLTHIAAVIMFGVSVSSMLFVIFSVIVGGARWLE